MSDWIKIEDAQPPRDQLALFCGIQGGIFLGYYCGSRIGRCGGRPSAAVFGCDGTKHRTVNAWIPVPAPYVDQEKLAAYEEIRNAYMFHHRLPKK